jgi:hypothetical protein
VPRWSTTADEPAAEGGAHATTFASLPLALAQHGIFARLPVDERLRCAEVCRAWRAALRECSLWRSLQLSTAVVRGIMKCRTRDEVGAIARGYGLHPRTLRRFDELLRAVGARADGGLQVLDVSESYASHAAVLDVVTANGGALRELCCSGLGQVDGTAQIEALLRAAPLLRRLDLRDMDLNAPGALDAVVDAAITCRMQTLSLGNACGFFFRLRRRRLCACSMTARWRS